MNVSYSAAELADWTVGEWTPAPPDAVTGCSHDTRSLQPGQVYVALRGEQFDGHDFLDDAFRRGAAGAVVAAEYAGCPSPDRPLLRVADTARALRDAAAAYRHKLNPHVIAVTGSVGKTTVKEITARIVAEKGPTARTLGNWNNDVGLPLSLLAMPSDTRYGVFEVGMNHPGEIERLCRIVRPDWGIVTNVGPVHMEFFKSIEDIAEEKSALLRALPPDGLAVLNRDGGFSDVLCRAAPGRVVTVSRRGNADYICTARRPESMEIDVLETLSGETRTLHLSSIAEHYAANTLLGVAIGRALSLDWDRIQAALTQVAPLPMRGAPSRVAGVYVVNDAYNANPLGMRASIRAFAEEYADRDRWLLLGDMRELGRIERDQHLDLGAFVAEGDWAGLMVLGDLGALIAEGAEAAGMEPERIFRCRTHNEAAETAKARLSPGDALLLKASRGLHLENVLRFMHASEGEET